MCLPAFFDSVRKILGRGLKIDSIGDGAEHLVGCFFFVEDGFEYAGIVGEAEDGSPGSQRAVDSDLMMLDLLTACDEGNVADAGGGGVLDAVLRFGH
jgi:hypothetical protein